MADTIAQVAQVGVGSVGTVGDAALFEILENICATHFDERTDDEAILRSHRGKSGEPAPRKRRKRNVSA